MAKSTVNNKHKDYKMEVITHEEPILIIFLLPFHCILNSDISIPMKKILINQNFPFMFKYCSYLPINIDSTQKYFGERCILYFF